MERTISKRPERNTRAQTLGEQIGEGRAALLHCPPIASSRSIGKAEVAHCISPIGKAEEDDDDDCDSKQRRLPSRQ